MTYYKLLAIAFFTILLITCWWWLFFKKKRPNSDAFPTPWRSILSKKVAFYMELSASEKVRFEENVLQFLDKILITGVDTDVNDTDKLLVAASAVIPLFGFPGWRYRNLREVLLYDGPFNQDYETEQGKARNILGMVGSGSMNHMMILSKPALNQGFEQQHASHNVGIHEFVHLLDKADGATDGLPEALIQQPYLTPWVKLMHREIAAIKAGRSDVDVYGSTNEAEFFSVVSEYFFQQPERLEKKHPALFDLLEKIFRQDLA
jgi:Mlc titration factor MtfA (ptsG expression regulator)